MVLPDSHRIARVLWYLVAFREKSFFAYGTITLYGALLQPDTGFRYFLYRIGGRLGSEGVSFRGVNVGIPL